MQWKDVPGYESIYEVSDNGDVRRLQDSDAYRAGSLLKPCLYANGYLRLTLRKNGKSRSYGVHRLVMMAFIGIESALDVNHLDGIKTHNHVNNLEYCTRKENINHAYNVLGRQMGELHGRARLPQAEVSQIFQAISDGNAVEWLAEVFMVKPLTIANIGKKKRWRFLLAADPQP